MRSLRPRGVLWQHGDFLKLWTGQSVSLLGSEITALALPLIAVLSLHATAFEVAALQACALVPLVLFSLPAGVWVDRLRRRPLLIVSDAGRAAVLASVPIAYALDVISIGQLYAVAFLVGTLAVPFDLAYLSYVPSLVPRDTLVEANAKLEGSRSAMHVVGPGLAGVLIGLLKAPVAIAVDAASFAISALSLAVIRRSEPDAKPRAERRPMRTELGEGLRYVFANRHLRGLIGCTGAWNLFSSMAVAIVLVYLVRRLGFTPEEIGGVFTLGSLGALSGALVARRLGARLGIGRTIVGGALVVGPGTAWIALAPTLPAAPVVVLTIFVAAFAGVVFNVNQLSLRQAITPPRLHGRMNAVVRVMYWGGAPLGAVIGGALAAGIGIRATLLVSGVLSFASFLPLLVSPVRSVRELPAETDALSPDLPVTGAIRA